MAPHILCIDTDPDGLVMLRRLFGSRDLVVEGAATFAEIDLAMRETDRPVVVIEPVLRGIDGFELCRAIRRTYAALDPTVMIASYRLRGDAQRQKAEDAGASGFFELPDDGDALVSAALLPLEAVAAKAPRRLPWRIVAAATLSIAGAAVWWGMTADPAGSVQPAREKTTAPANRATDVKPPAPVATLAIAEPVIEEATPPPPRAEPVRLELPPLPARRRLVSIAEDGLTEPIVEFPALATSGGTSGVDALVPDDLAPPPVFIAPQRIADRHPRYPPIARKLGRSGFAVVQAEVDTDGSVTELNLIAESDELLGFGASALEAVSRWRYEPATRDGVPVRDTVTVRLVFSP